MVRRGISPESFDKGGLKHVNNVNKGKSKSDDTPLWLCVATPSVLRPQPFVFWKVCVCVDRPCDSFVRDPVPPCVPI